jgi:hypothetical protein
LATVSGSDGSQNAEGKRKKERRVSGVSPPSVGSENAKGRRKR